MTEITLKKIGGGGSKQRRLNVVQAQKHIRNLKYNLKKAGENAEAILNSRLIGDMKMREEIAEFIEKTNDWHEAVGRW